MFGCLLAVVDECCVRKTLFTTMYHPQVPHVFEYIDIRMLFYYQNMAPQLCEDGAVQVLVHVQALNDKQCSREQLKQRAIALEHMGTIFLEVGNKALDASTGKDVEGSNQQDIAAQRIEKALQVRVCNLCVCQYMTHTALISLHSVLRMC